MLRPLIRLGLGLTGWKTVGDPPPGLQKYVIISAPHTSNWDFLLLLSYCWYKGVPLRWMAKNSIFKGPFGALFKAMGGVPIDRSKATNMVGKMVDAFNKHDRIAISVPPEGTRKKVEYWKSGFYHLARGANVPLVLSFIDGPGKRMGFGPVIHLTGDMQADMVPIAAFYKDIVGVNPANMSPVRLKPEAAEAPPAPEPAP